VNPDAWVLGADVGGTFTDLVLTSAAGSLHTAKVPTTPADPIEGIVRGVGEVLRDAGIDAADVTRFVHGTTLAANVILQRTVAPVALVTTEGFADLLRLGRAARGVAVDRDLEAGLRPILLAPLALLLLSLPNLLDDERR